MRTHLLAAATLFALLGAPATVARAAPEGGGVDRCLGANTAAQSLRRDGKFGAARAELTSCVDASCPAMVRDDCTQRLDELERAQPTIVFAVKGDQGHDISEVTVEVDGRPFAQRLEGIAMAIDPGEHTFTFETKGQPKVTRKFVLREGDKGRKEQILLGAAAPTVATGFSTAGSSRGDAAPLGTQRAVAIAALGVGLVGIGTGVAFAVQAKSKSNDADAFCPGSACANDAALRMNQDARSAGNLATVAFTVGAVGVAGAAVLWLTAKPSSSSPSASLALGAGTVQVRGTW